jgi:ATP-dependent DNA ligase
VRDESIGSRAATLTYERFEGPEWIFERKLDGIRLLAFKNGGDVQLLSRRRCCGTARRIDAVGDPWSDMRAQSLAVAIDRLHRSTSEPAER